MAVDIASIIGSIIGAGSEQVAVDKTNIASAKEAATQRDWASGEAGIARDFTERMSSTSFQRGVADLRKAGINPMLAYMKGGASTPGAGAPSGAKATMVKSDVGKLLQSTVSTALESKRLNADVKKVSSQTELNKMSLYVQDEVRKLNMWNAQSAKVNAEIAKANKPAMLQDAKNRLWHKKADYKWRWLDTADKRTPKWSGVRRPPER